MPNPGTALVHALQQKEDNPNAATITPTGIKITEGKQHPRYGAALQRAMTERGPELQEGQQAMWNVAGTMGEAVAGALPGVGEAMDISDIVGGIAGQDYARAGLGAAGLVLPVVGGRTLGKAGEALTKAMRGGSERARQYQRVGDVWHGTPHDFEDVHIGPSTARSGEGGEHFGRGGYVTQDEKLALKYWKGLKAGSGGELEDVASRVLRHSDGNYETAIAEMKRRIQDRNDRLISAPHTVPGHPKSPSPNYRESFSLDDVLKYLETGKNPLGQVMKLRVKGRWGEFIDLDKPVLKQYPAIQEKFMAIYKSESKRFDIVVNKAKLKKVENNSPLKAMKEISSWYGPKDVDRLRILLSKAGIKGNAFLTAKSRHLAGTPDAHKGTRNLVIFDDKDLKTLSRTKGVDLATFTAAGLFTHHAMQEDE